jgi:hypothetical protein
MSTVRYSFHIRRTAAGAPKRLQAGKAEPVPDKVPRIARLLALAHKFQGMLDRGEVKSMADLARFGGVSRARVTQIMNLLLLAPEIQEDLLFIRSDIALQKMLQRARLDWSRQRLWWSALQVPKRSSNVAS